MDALVLSRIQFAVTAVFHFLFVPLTLGLSLLIAYMEARYVRTRDDLYLRMARFWGRLFLINFALGVVTGITMEFQFGMNWARYAQYVGDIFGAPLAIEALVAFSLESVFIGLWVFGWDRVSARVHAFAIAVVALATNLSALWILLANGWMQRPVGFVLRHDRAELVDFAAFLTNGYGWLKFFHTILAGYVVAAFFVMGIAAWHILQKNEPVFFKRSFRIAAVFGFVSALGIVAVGHHHGAEVARVQPAKLAAMESHWETGRAVPMYVLILPDQANARNTLELIGIPGLMSFLAHGDFQAEVKGLRAFAPEERPPVLPVFASFRGMVGLGFLFVLLAAAAVALSVSDRLERHPLFLRGMLYAIPLPYLAGELGWIVAEMGRQPWIVYGVLKTGEAGSRAVSAGQVAVSLTGFVLLYGFLAVLDVYLLARTARSGPDRAPGAHREGHA